MDHHPYRLASRRHRREDTIVRIGRVAIGGDAVALIAGPCSVEGREQTLALAARLDALGIAAMRGGAFKPRTSPYSFQGLGRTGLEILAEVRERHGLAVVTEAMTPEEVPLVAAHADMLQIGSRNMPNYRLLEAAGRARVPVLLKRGMSATIEELLCAAEYVLAAGNPDVVLCERGLRHFDPAMRGSFDLGAIPLLRELTHLPVIADPSHATGRSELVPGVALGAVASGAHGVIVEVHERPEAALSDGRQSLTPDELETLVARLRLVAGADGRVLGVGSAAHVEQLVFEGAHVA